MAVIENVITIGMFIAFNSYRGVFSSRMGSLIDILFSLRMLSLHRERIADIAMTEVEKELYTKSHKYSLWMRLLAT